MSVFRRTEFFSTKVTSKPQSLTRTPQPAIPKTVPRPLMDLTSAQFTSNVLSTTYCKEDRLGNTLSYSDKVWVRVRTADREDWRTQLDIKVEIRPSNKEQILCIELTDDKDPFFLFTIECSETNFFSLKSEQDLRVEFQQFPNKFIELLGLSQKEGGLGETERFCCLFQIGYTTEATFSIIEKNQFKLLTHLSLKFKAGDDETLKAYLARKLQNYKAECEDLNKKLEAMEDALNVQTNMNEKLKGDFTDQKEENRKIVDTMQLEAHKQLNNLKEQMLAELDSANSRHGYEKEQMHQRFEEELNGLKEKVTDLQKVNAELKESNIKLEASERELLNKVQGMEHTLELQENELTMLRGTNKGLDTTKYTQEKELIELKVKCETMEKQLADRGILVQKTTGLYESCKAQCVQLEETIKILKATNGKMEEKLKQSVNEINKGNEIIKHLQSDLKSAKQKAKLKEGVVSQQEQVIEQNKRTAEEYVRTIDYLKREQGYKEEELKNVKGKVEELTKKLEESQKLLASNDQSIFCCITIGIVIQWLNKSLSEAQRAPRSTLTQLPPYNFRPSYGNIDQLSGKALYSTNNRYVSKYSNSALGNTEEILQRNQNVSPNLGYKTAGSEGKKVFEMAGGEDKMLVADKGKTDMVLPIRYLNQ